MSSEYLKCKQQYKKTKKLLTGSAYLKCLM